MRINVLGGGPAGLYLSLLMMRRDPSHRITVFERDAADDTFGWGIVFSDRTLAFLRDRDEPTYSAITAASQRRAAFTSARTYLTLPSISSYAR